MYQEVFVDFCKVNLSQIVEEADSMVLTDLLKIMGVGLKKQEQLLEESYVERVKARYQTSFWREFLM